MASSTWLRRTVRGGVTVICDPCKIAGKQNRAANVPGANVDYYIAKAELGHNQCEAPTTCPCQHRLGKHVKES